MEIEAEIEVVEVLHTHAKLLRTAQRSTPQKTKAAANWEIRLAQELARLKASVATLPGLEPTGASHNHNHRAAA